MSRQNVVASQRELPLPDARVAASLVLFASPTAEVRRRWRQGLQGMFAFHEVAELAELERAMVEFSPAILLLDISLPQAGIGELPAIQRLSPPTKIVLFTSSPNEREAIAVLKAGARGYHSKDIEPDLLNKTVQTVLKGEIWVRRNVIPHLLSELTALTGRPQQESPAKFDGRLNRLTAREREVTRLIGSGASNKEIAGRLNITERTVKAHLTVIFQKLRIPDRLRLALFVSEHARDVTRASRSRDWTKVQLTAGSKN